MPAFLSLVASVLLVVFVAMLLKGLTQPPALPGQDVSLDNLFEDSRGLMAQAEDFTRPRVKDIAVLVARLPELKDLTPKIELEELYSLADTFYRVVAEASDARKGEVGHLAGDEIFVVFGRFLAVDEPLKAALDAALEIQDKLGPAIAQVKIPVKAAPLASVAVTRGPAMSGPLGSATRKSYSSVGRVPMTAFQLAREAAPGTVVIPLELTAQAIPFYDLDETPDARSRARRVTGRKGAAPPRSQDDTPPGNPPPAD